MKNNKLLLSIMLITGIVLFLDGFILILYKKWHIGTVLPFFIGLIFIITALCQTKIHSLITRYTVLKKIWRWGWSLFSIWLISLLVFFCYIHLKAQQNDLTENVQAIIVLGSGITQGKASPTLAKRLDKAGEVAKQQTQAIIIVSGGLDFGETKTESEIMAQYLQENNQIQANRILQENQSTSTELNLKNSQAILKTHHIHLNDKIAIITSDFHTLRAGAIAKKQGYLNIVTVGAETPITTRYNAWLREYFAYLSGWVLGEY